MGKTDSNNKKQSISGKFARFIGTLVKTGLLLGLLLLGLYKLPTIMAFFQSANKTSVPRKTEAPVAPKPIDWSKVDAAVAAVMKSARLKAEKNAQSRIEEWTGDMMNRVDDDFLEWYFDYWNQQILELKSLWYWSLNKLMDNQPTYAERITEDVQFEFANRVLRPQVAQLELENITRDVMDIYVYELRKGLSEIPQRYKIPQGEWDVYLQDVAMLASGTEGNRQVDVSLKAVMIGGASSAVLFSAPLRSVSSRFGRKLSPGFAKKSASKLATLTGKKVARKTGGRLLGPIIAIGIMVWDFWDHEQTKQANKPLLRSAIADYFQEMRAMLMYDTDSGFMTVIHDMELNVVESLPSRNEDNFK